MSKLSLARRRGRLGAWGGVAGLLAAAALAGAGTPAFAAEDPIIHGLVKDAAGHKVDGWVEVTDSATDGAVFDVTYGVDSGEYAFRVPAGSYKLQFGDHSGLGRGEFYNDEADAEHADPVVVATADRALDPVVLALNPSVHGLVTDAGGNPLDGTVYAYAEDPETHTYGSTAVADAGFDSGQSDLLLPHLAPGNYKLRFEPGDTRYASEFYNDKADLDSATVVAVTSTGATLSPVVLARRPSLRGSLTDPYGNRVFSGWVTLFQKNDTGTYSEFQRLWADQSGEIDGIVPEGTYKLKMGGQSYDADGWHNLADRWYGGNDLDSATPVDFTAAGLTLPNVQLAWAPSSDLTGAVKDAAGHSVRGLTVEAYYDYYGDGSYWQYRYSASTRSDGSYAIPNASTGSYKLRFYDGRNRYLDAWYGGVDQESATVVTLDEDGTRVGPVVVHTGGSVAGRVTDSAGRGIPDAEVWVVPASGGGEDGWADALADGSYTVTELPAGTYKLYARADDYVGGYLGQTSQWLLAETITVGNDQALSGQDIALDAEAARPVTGVDVTGKVTDVAGTPLAGVSVSAYRADNGQQVDYAVTDTAGTYRMVYLDKDAPTGYKLEFHPYGYSDGPSLSSADAPAGQLAPMAAWYGGKNTPTASPLVTVTRGSTVTANQSLQRYGGIKGRIAADDGGVLDGWVSVYDTRADELEWAEVDADGTYTIPNVTPGTRYLEASDDSHLTSWYANGFSPATATPFTVRSGTFTTGINVVLSKSLRSTTAPTVSGRPLVGQRLTAQAGTWEEGTDLDIQWLRGTTVVGTGSSYLLKPADAGQRISVRVLASAWNVTGQATSASTGVVKYVSAVSATGKYKKKKVRLTLTVSVPGLARPGGSVTVTDRGRKVGSASIGGSAVTLTLRKQRKGRHAYVVTYSGTGTVAAASTTVGVKVR